MSTQLISHTPNMPINQESSNVSGQDQPQPQQIEQRGQVPQQTYEKTSFQQLMLQYNHMHNVPPTLELTQAYLLTQNMKEAAARVQGLTPGGAQYFFNNELVGDCGRLSDAIQQMSRLVSNIGTSDKASNFMIEQRNLLRTQARENKDIREAIDEKLIEEELSSDEDVEKHQQDITQEDSQQAEELNQRIRYIISMLRKDAKEYLQNGKEFMSDDQSLHKIWKLLRKSPRYRKKRESKALHKQQNNLEQIINQMEGDLLEVQMKTKKFKNLKALLTQELKMFEQTKSLEKRLKTEKFPLSITELDQLPITKKTFDIQNILFSYCGLKPKAQKRKNEKSIFGNIKALPQKSTLLQAYQDHGENKGTFIQNENSLTNQARKRNIELVKVIGLEPSELFNSLDKYKINIYQMPKFSHVFDRAEPIIPGFNMTVAGQILQSNQGGQMSFARVDGRNVISLQFNPYNIDDTQKKKVYDTAVKELVEQREKIKNLSKQSKEKQEQSTIKRAWLNIVKKDIPKAYRGYQKFKTDQETNNKKQTQNCLKEVRKKAARTQRQVKEQVMRAKKLTKEMMNFWKRRDKEIADLKRKKEKIDKELRKKQEEEKEALLQKKRLEFIMQQSEIYAHFMSKNLGLADEQQKQRYRDLEEEEKDNFKRVEIDQQQARLQVAQMINSDRSRVVRFDQETHTRRQHNMSLNEINEDELVVDKFDNPDASHSTIMQAPSCFKGHLKDYQLKGLRWLDNLYEQGINGILADEMGLGKTIQAISLLAHLVENKSVWGPFLIVVPVTTLHNWQNELAKFCPKLKVLPYFGNPEERKKLGRYLDPKNLYNPTMQINVLLTSYNLLVNNQKDQQKLMRVRWHYMILDEAQAIKNNLSRRWRVLLQFNARNRLLLTGTPIQNSMAELWALLHFIMPKLFDNHEQFQEWFSKDIEQHSQNQGEISKHQLKRLHLVLKPFMLRRLKKDVESEIGQKYEYQQYCEMTHRQRVLYQRIKDKISTKDLFQLVVSKQKMENLMNLVMQFRKVCNHPELFERRVGRIPFQFRSLQTGMQPNPVLPSQPELRPTMKNPISLEIPKLVFDECFNISDNNMRLFKQINKYEMNVNTHFELFNIFTALNLHNEIFNNKKTGLGILRLLAVGNKWSLSELAYLFVADPIIKQVALMHYYYQKNQKKIYQCLINNNKDKVEYSYHNTLEFSSSFIDVNFYDIIRRDEDSLLYSHISYLNQQNKVEILPPLITSDLNTFTNYTLNMKEDFDIYVDKCQAETISLQCHSGTFQRLANSLTNSGMLKKILLGKDFKPKQEHQESHTGRDRSSFLVLDNIKYSTPIGYHLFDKGIIGEYLHEKGACLLELPNYSRLVTDCAKMQILDKLLGKLRTDNHRCLIFCQMTKMLDILEDFLSWRQFTYFRMDGSTSIQDRRYMVEEYQKNNDIFAFLLSTRAGGLGVNLTGADTVIFYDNDWNPTMDAQATDRAHRIGQTKAVSVYRIVTKGTVEEKIVKRAKQKQNVQSTVYGGNALKADVFKPKDVVEMLLDEEEQQEINVRSQKFLKTKRIRRGPQEKEEPKPKVKQPKKEQPQVNNNIFTTQKKDLFNIQKPQDIVEQEDNIDDDEDEMEEPSDNMMLNYQGYQGEDLEDEEEEEEEDDEEAIQFNIDEDNVAKNGKQAKKDEDELMEDEY